MGGKDRPKTIYSMIFQKVIEPDMFYWIRHCKVEVCALPSAVLVTLAEGQGTVFGCI